MANDFVSISMKIRNQEVTGSQTKLVVKNGNSSTLLVDNGAFQDREGEEFTVEDYSDVDAAFATHAHMDHIGEFAELAKQRNIPIYATTQTIQLHKPMMYDSYNVMSMHGRPFTKEDMKALLKLGALFKEAKLYSKIGGHNYEATFIDNAHILGASMIYLKALDNYRPLNILFSGDYREEHPFLRTHGINNFLKSNPVDVLVLESTYGNKDAHIPFSDSINMLEDILVEGIKKGDVLLGSFSVDRTPVLLYMINQIQKSNPVFDSVPVYLDGGLAIEALNIYKENENKFKCSWADIIPKNFEAIEGKAGRKNAQADPRHKIIIATSGQFHGGSIISWAAKMLSDPNATIVQSGYISHAVGKQIFEMEQGEILDYFGQPIKVMAQRKVLAGTSAHADRHGLAKLVERCYKVNPKLKVILTHGEPEAKTALKDFLASKVLSYDSIYIQSATQHFEINKHTLASGEILIDD